MSKPIEIAQLVEELRGESQRGAVETSNTSYALIFLGDQCDENKAIQLNADDCRLLFDSPSTVDRLCDALESGDASLNLVDLTVPDDVRDALERQFNAVDED